MEENLKVKISNILDYYVKRNEILIDFFTLFGMVCHTYFYQKLEKGTVLNTISFSLLVYDLIWLAIVNDFVSTMLRYNFLTPSTYSWARIGNAFILPFILFIYNLKVLSNVAIESYYTSFLIFKTLWVFSNSIKTVAVYLNSKFVSDLLKLMDTIWVINLLLIALTDPLINNDQHPNQICFYEIYFRYIEYHNLVLAGYLVYTDRNIDSEIAVQSYTTSSIIGRYDSFRFTTILVLVHYYFIFINGIAFSTKYLIGFSSCFVSFYVIQSYRQRKMANLYVSFVILIMWNLISYIIALYWSVSSIEDNQVAANITAVNATSDALNNITLNS